MRKSLISTGDYCSKKVACKKQSLSRHCLTSIIALASIVAIPFGLNVSAEASSDRLWKVVIDDWGGYNIGGGRQTPYDGDGNGSELYFVADIKVHDSGKTSEFSIYEAFCISDCYDDQ